MQETWSIKKSPENIYVSEGQFPEHKVPHPDLFHDYLSGQILGQWAAVASDLILVEPGGGQHSLSRNLLRFCLNFNQDLAEILTILSQGAGMLTPRLGKDFTDKPVKGQLLT